MNNHFFLFSIAYWSVSRFECDVFVFLFIIDGRRRRAARGVIYCGKSALRSSIKASCAHEMCNCVALEREREKGASL